MKILKKIIPREIAMRIADYRRRQKSLSEFNPDAITPPTFTSSFAGLDYYRCIYVHIPKNAGLSVSYALFGNTGGSHRKIMDYRAVFSKKTFMRYFKFTFVRNPYDRLVSTYFFLKNGGLTKKDANWAIEHLSQYKDFDQFVTHWISIDHVKNSLHFQPQHLFLENSKGENMMDFIGRFENLEEDFAYVAKKIGANASLEKTNISKRSENYREYYTAETKKIVKEVYSRDFELFQYEF